MNSGGCQPWRLSHFILLLLVISLVRLYLWNGTNWPFVFRVPSRRLRVQSTLPCEPTEWPSQAQDTIGRRRPSCTFGGRGARVKTLACVSFAYCCRLTTLLRYPLAKIFFSLARIPVSRYRTQLAFFSKTFGPFGRCVCFADLSFWFVCFADLYFGSSARLFLLPLLRAKFIWLAVACRWQRRSLHPGDMCNFIA